MQDADWLAEQRRVDNVTTKIRQRLESLDAEVGKVKRDVVSIRKNFWDDVTVNLSSPDDLVETHFSIRQQAEVLSERERRYQQAVKAYNKLTRLVESPYFGRIDFQESGSSEVEEIYLGIGSFVDDEDNFLVYDWRAPISSLYYDYSPGPVAYRAPFGEVTGEMLKKRQFTIRGGHIVNLFDTGVTIGDELLMQVLSQQSNAQMKSIVATIQREQNQIIRNDSSRLLVVQGAAGSGKTSAALQRVAYLLYKYREVLKADQMVLFSPNPLFNSYVSTVLPELGEENMQQTTFQEYLEHRLGAEYTLDDPFVQIEYVLHYQHTTEYEARIQSIAYKASVRFLDTMKRYLLRLETQGMIFKPLLFEDREVVSAAAMLEKFYSCDPALHLQNRVEFIRDWILEQLTAFSEREAQATWVEEAIQWLEPEDYQRAYKQLNKMQRGKRETFDDFAKEQEILSRMVVKDRLKSLRKWVHQLEFVDVHAIYKQLFEDESVFHAVAGDDVPPLWSEMARQTVQNLSRMHLMYEDAAPFLYLKEGLQGLHTNTTIRHLIVDEAQDYSPFQLEFLKKLFPRAKMTALGDLNQAIYVHDSAFDEFDALCKLYGEDQTQIIRLTKSYRSTRPIVEFTKGMVSGGEAIEPFNRMGEKPLVVQVPDQDCMIRKIKEDIEALQAAGHHSIAVLCKTAGESASVHEQLSRQLPIRHIKKSTVTFEREPVVIPTYLAKGLEFDAVLIFDGSAETYHRESERKLFYTACTRAMHVLHIYSPGEASPFILEQPSETFVLQ